MSDLPAHVLAIDPGGTTGFAALHGAPKRSNVKAWRVANGPWPKQGDPPKDQTLDCLLDFCHACPAGDDPKNPASLVVCERFHTGQQQNRYSHFTIELIGAIEGICYAERVPLLLVINKERRQFTPRAEAILGRKHNPNHDDDDLAALAHLLAFIARAQSAKGASTP